MTLSSLWHTVYPVLIAILFFELIILVHEGGHYIAARLMKIKVNEFSVGMGPKIIQRERNGTKFTLRWILFGGYCQMEGEGEDSEDPNAFNKKSVPARLFVVVAGALMNLVLGFLLTVLIVCGSNLIGTAQVAKFEANAASAASGLQVGDTIQSIDGMRVYTATDVTTGLSRSADDTLTVVVKRDGAKKTLQVKFDTEEYEGHRFVKMDFWLHGVPKNVGNVLRESVNANGVLRPHGVPVRGGYAVRSLWPGRHQRSGGCCVLCEPGGENLCLLRPAADGDTHHQCGAV